MDIQNLRTFITVARMQSFSLAAEKLHLTQPAVTKRIQMLESQVKTRLFDRIGRNFFLTEAGSCLLPFADKILQLVDEGKQALTDLDKDIKGDLRIVTSHHIGLHRLPKILQAFRKQYPQVKIHLEFLDSAEAHEAILAGQVDVGVTTEVIQQHERINTKVVWEDQLHFVVALQHPLTRIKNLKLADIAEYSAILADQKFYTSRLVMKLFEKHKLQFRFEEGLGTNYLESIRALLIVGDNWSVLPASMLDKKQLAILHPAGIKLSRKLVCISHQDRSLNKASQAFIQLLDTQKGNS